MDKAKQIIKLLIVASVVVQAIPALIKHRAEIKDGVTELFGSVTHAIQNNRK